MRIVRGALDAKGWYLGPWNSELPVALGYANEGVDEPHFHTELTEVYVIGRGEASVRVGDETVELQAGDVLVIEPGEPHTFLMSSPDYFHLVIHVQGEMMDEKRAVERAELGLS